MREKLIELIKDARRAWDSYLSMCIKIGEVPNVSCEEFLADHLLENGGRAEAIKECVNKYTEMLIDEYHLRTYLQIASIKRLEQKVLAKMAGGEMREILYRGKVKETGEWVEGFYIKQRDSLLDGIVHHYIVAQEKNKNGLLNPLLTWYDVIPETVGQHTGLTDTNGKKIFEGDIHERENHFFVVKHGKYRDCETGEDGYGWYFEYTHRKECEGLYGTASEYVNIIGNIHDNKELVKGGAE